MAKFMRTDKGTEDPKEDTRTADPSPVQELHAPVQARQSSDISVISASLRVTGDLESDAEIQLDGRVEGNVRGKVVTIGEGANITGSVYGETVNVAGTINGTIEARTVMVSKTAHSTGDIIHESLQIEAGAYVDGHCRPEFGKSAQSKPVAQQSQPDVKAADKPEGATTRGAGATATATVN